MTDNQNSKWVIVQLTPTGEREKNLSNIIRTAKKILRNQELDIFIPAISQKVRGETQIIYYMDGYIFIKFVDNIQYLKLNDTFFFSSVICGSGDKRRTFSLIDDKSLDHIRLGLQSLKIKDFSENDMVKVIKGTYKNLVGKVNAISDDSESVQVFVDLRSKKILMDFPSSYLEKLDCAV